MKELIVDHTLKILFRSEQFKSTFCMVLNPLMRRAAKSTLTILVKYSRQKHSLENVSKRDVNQEQPITCMIYFSFKKKISILRLLRKVI